MISAGCWMRAFVTGSDNSGTHGFVVTLFLAGTLEELGWRGFLQPRLRQRFDVVWVSIGIGVTWVVRHVPMMVAGFGDFAAFWEHTLNKRQYRSSTTPSLDDTDKRVKPRGQAPRYFTIYRITSITIVSSREDFEC